MSFRDNLQYLRSTKQMTQEQLAMMLGVSRQSVTKWEAEKSYPEMDKLIKICQIFEVTLDDLVTGDVTQSELARYNQKNLRRLGEKELDMLDVGGAEQKRIREQWKRSRKLEWMSNTIMLLATCLAIILMFTAPPVFFLPWVVAAVLCSILRNRERNSVA